MWKFLHSQITNTTNWSILKYPIHSVKFLSSFDLTSLQPYHHWSWCAECHDYEKQVGEVEHASFSKLSLFYMSGGISASAAVVYKHLGSLISFHTKKPLDFLENWSICWYIKKPHAHQTKFGLLNISSKLCETQFLQRPVKFLLYRSGARD